MECVQLTCHHDWSSFFFFSTSGLIDQEKSRLGINRGQEKVVE
ncbi:hypothetical protein ERO13_D08G175150v2 [Gossypium hirsutum]|uniref:Uncharacterized protein n=1 Tax=Gossypium darwinii TaxID=34276 RepID=A0A5D2BLB9_GOSDA|nr:hypothetical protein ERO13_D08G175150v2 [Gossypium hirsutum]TYG58184.1 hypothetical protein ES288_D08G202100v1 [Gossypium darwinii]